MEDLKQRPLIVAYGGGTNSTAMLCGFRERGIKPDLILFADTGGELPGTYEHVRIMDSVCKEWFGIKIETVRATYKGEFEGLERNCIRKEMLPSLAYGKKGCSQKYKVQPQTRRMIKWMDENGHKQVTKCIGYDANEGHRKTKKAYSIHRKGRKEFFWYPLISWQWGRRECVEAIMRHGITPPGKSACFFCPAMKRHEIVRLRNEHPDLYARAIALEANAKTDKNMGLTGRSLRWSDIVAQDDAQAKLWDFLDQNDPQGIPCGCYDG